MRIDCRVSVKLIWPARHPPPVQLLVALVQYSALLQQDFVIASGLLFTYLPWC